MLGQAFRDARWRLLVGGLVIGAAVAAAPEAASARAWWAVALSALGPWLVLGRDAHRIRRGLREPARCAPRLGAWVIAELVPATVVVIAGALALTGHLASAAALSAWSLFLLVLADVFDRRAARAGAAWVGVLLVMALVATAPLWAAIWFGQTAWAPWPATLTVGVHPAAITLVGAGHPALQDPIFYRWTLSGVVEVRPLTWALGAALYLGLALALVPGAIAAARRPVRARAGGARSRGLAPNG